MDVFVVQLRKAMFLKGWKQVDLSKATGYRDGKVSAWYNGKYRPNAETTAKIAKALADAHRREMADYLDFLGGLRVTFV